MPRKRKPLDAVWEAPVVARLLRREPPGPRRERLPAVQLAFDSANDLDRVAAASRTADSLPCLLPGHLCRSETGSHASFPAEYDLFGFAISGHPLELFNEVAWDTYCPVNRLS